MKKILINTSNLQQGGALQVAVSFINEVTKITDINFFIFLGKATSKLINQDDYNYSHIKFYNIDIHPSDSALSFFQFRRKLAKMESEIRPTAVITVFGPCYWKPKAPHIMGFANGYLLYEDTYFFEIWDGWKKLRYQLKKKFHQYLLKREATDYWTETEDSKKRLSQFLGVQEDDIIVATNNCSHFFSESPYEVLNTLPIKKRKRLVYISSYYPHKGFEIIPPVLDILKEGKVDIEIVVTINDIEYKRLFDKYDNVINLGHINPKYCPYIYTTADIVFAPTLLETFTAIYPEAMYMQKPILTSDLPFAKDICREAASYFDPRSPEDAADKILVLLNNDKKVEELVTFGNIRIKDFDSPKIRFEKILKKITNEI